MGVLDVLSNANPVASAVEGGVKGFLAGAGQLARDLRAAITGKEVIDATKAAELETKLVELEANIQQAQISVVLAESQSADPWTSRARPSFMYVIYLMLLVAIPMGVLSAFNPKMAQDVAAGYQAWLKAIPSDLYALFGAGYLGYGAFRTFDKVKGGK